MAKKSKSPLDPDAMRRYMESIEKNWARAAKQMENCRRALSHADLAKSATSRKAFLKAAKDARAAAGRWLKPMRKMRRAIKAQEAEK